MKDDYLWLEEIQSEKALQWVKEKSDASVLKLQQYSRFKEIEGKALEAFGATEKIPYVTIEGDYVYNLWNDEFNVQGLLRRASITSYVSEQPEWEVILDLDALSLKEKVCWVYAGIEFNSSHSKALMGLSPGGSDANVMREFDLVKKEFVPDGFILPESKGWAEWIDDDTLRIVRVFGEDSITDSGYSRTVRDLKRGESIDSAKIIFEVDKKDMQAYSKTAHSFSVNYRFLGRWIDFYSYEEMILQDGAFKKLNLPSMFQDFGVVGHYYVLMMKEKWSEYEVGDVVAYDLDNHSMKKIFSCEKNQSVYTISRSKTGLYAIIDEDVKGNLYKFTLKEDGEWSKVKIDLPANGTLDFLSTDWRSDHFFLTYSSFNQPATYYYGEGEKIIKASKVAPSFFDHNNVIVEQHFSTSLDGTQIPYFLIYKRGTSFNGKNPTILYGYGGFEISMKAHFNNGLGANWIEKGGVYVLSNIRGGGEYGPHWHQSALKENRHKAYEDFFSIAEDLIAKKVTSSEHLGAMGGSNGGLLMGVCYTQRPKLFKAIDCGVPLLDMYRYHKLLAGASWVAEYGDPEDEKDGAYIRSISPYQQIKEEGDYPVMFLNTSTKDDRVHPGHARKFAAKLFQYGHRVYYYENILGGHGGASNFKELAFNHALHMSFFWTHLT